ncbi:hypothetical protein [Vibrio genomosp. F10]|uniref:Outer membrane protein beta-barrel domain-containing protein n=1 Tax=Vibrio genomosp. F10 TaxID=723171 RepID=A0A1B9QZN3_9VIBR|nr:hypothetical protein [Vibrio genomosp. F10]OCH76638.1 hypothetical protein A6E14_08925 [Vibrio genomosp. F10]
MNKRLVGLLSLSLYAFSAQAEEEKHHEDPTKIVTKVGIAYVDGVQFSGSIGLDDARMINARINADGDEWRLGGSWLLPMGILNFNFSRAEYEPEGYKNNYSIGSFIPLSYFDITPLGWQIFPMAGYSYNDGEIAGKDSESDNDYVMTRFTSHGGYLGMFALKPLSEKWSLMTFGGGSMGSDNYSGYWVGTGLSHKLSQSQSFNFFGVIADDDFGQNNRIGISYTYEFK